MFQILVATTDDKFLDRNYKLSTNHLIINQLLDIKQSKYQQKNLISLRERGVSKSRNRAIENTHFEIALISDDDVEFLENIENIVVDAFKKNPDADIITFQAKIPTGEPFKSNYKTKSFYHNLKTIMRVSTIEMAFRVESIKKNNLKFDEEFGLGSNYPTGEEAIFLSDAIKKGLRILYIPTTIVSHAKESSGGMFKNNPKLIEAKGAMFYRIFALGGYLVSLLFALKKYKMSNYSFIEFYKLMLIGTKDFKVRKDVK